MKKYLLIFLITNIFLKLKKREQAVIKKITADQKLDKCLEDTFPSSDPIAVY